ncbi:MAG: hypothetical protein WCL38_03050 [Actinomycetota bacterium]
MELFLVTPTIQTDTVEPHTPDVDAGYCLICRTRVRREGLLNWVHEAS